MPEEPEPSLPPPAQRDDIARGEQLFRSLACGRCHRFTGSTVDDAALHAQGRTQVGPLDGAWALAPDLRFARQRMTVASMAAWIETPRGSMPALGVTADNARALAAFIANAPLIANAPIAAHRLALTTAKTRAPISGDARAPISGDARAPISGDARAPISGDTRAPISGDTRASSAGDDRAIPTRLPILTRAVTYDEVDKRVFKNVCWHCHAVPDFARGDGGPGNSGGFGFAPRGLDVSSYEGLASGSLDDDGERRSIFAKLPDGTPRVVAHLMARYVEEAGGTVDGVRGMPLGLPPLSLEEIQLVESWIAQGRPR